MSATLHPPEQRTGAARRVLVIGYGNPGREDDGLGAAAAQGIARLDLPGVSTLDNYQLVLEDAVEIAAHDAVWFVDASRDGDSPCAIHRLEPAFDISFTTHLMKPKTLLAITAQQFGRRPTAHLLSIRGYRFGFREGLSTRAAANLSHAIDLLAGCIGAPVGVP
jgi:hydrogenase maturation protease